MCKRGFHEGFQTIRGTNGLRFGVIKRAQIAQGLEKFNSSPVGFIDAVLTDIRMPVMDGLELAKAIRSLSRADAKTVAIIAMTANAFEEDVNKSQLAGMDAHLSKPIEPELLYKTLQRCITSRES